MKTVGQLKDEIRRQTWPSGEAENLKGVQPDGSMGGHDLIFQEGLAEIAKWVVCEQSNNVDVIGFCKTNFKCGMTIVEAPHGFVRNVFTVVGNDFCDPVFLREVDWPLPEVFGRNLLPYLMTNTNLPARFPLGFTAADGGNDSKCGRARTGIWCKHNGNIYIAPWIQSVENVVIVWDGIKKRWSDDDPVNDDQDYKKALKLYLQYGHERDYGSNQAAQMIHNIGKTGTFDEALGDLMWGCDQRRKVRDTAEALRDLNWMGPKLVELGLPPTPILPQVLAMIGNYGISNANTAAVSALVHSMGPSFVLAEGGNTELGGPTIIPYDNSAGLYYHDFLSPYTGIHGEGSPTGQRFYTVIGQVEEPIGFGAFFNPPGNGRYYDVCLGLVHVFFVNAQSAEPDGIISTSAQAQWLRAKMLLSTAPWKIVVTELPPYSSQGAGYSYADLRWPFKDWGANLVVSGFAWNYERLNILGLDYIVNGLGGTFNPSSGETILASSKVLLHSFGALRLTPAQASLLIEYVDTTDAPLDSLTLKK